MLAAFACLGVACRNGAAGQGEPAQQPGQPGASAASPDGASATHRRPPGNAPYAGVIINYPHSGCSFAYSPVDFCDADHRAQIETAIRTQAPNFNRHYLLAVLQERKAYFQQSIVLIDSRDGTVFPLPIDAFSGRLAGTGGATSEGTVETAVDSDTFCVSGALLVYRAFEQGRFCFGFDGQRFTGHPTQYMN
ncbi:hypothetical protein [Stenotrophomonas sp. 24(2023)]|uniref:hypothetical protein n=1 Tax=Stenotrophomonas sp. 24(2023) TaxID=3068324 RepID=UPI0027DF06D9|nr:hypothetical protein [Stenotrophomonas sp. 24(2023)]WMJ69516.1 hypothetical protein Q9R17_20440 [Stenotrophomonas sp. 24(2023)]